MAGPVGPVEWFCGFWKPGVGSGRESPQEVKARRDSQPLRKFRTLCLCGDLSARERFLTDEGEVRRDLQIQHDGKLGVNLKELGRLDR